MIAGRRLFAGDTEGEVIAKLRRCDVPRWERRDVNVSRGLESVVRRMLPPEPEGRFATTDEAAAAI